MSYWENSKSSIISYLYNNTINDVTSNGHKCWALWGKYWCHTVCWNLDHRVHHLRLSFVYVHLFSPQCKQILEIFSHPISKEQEILEVFHWDKSCQILMMLEVTHFEKAGGRETQHSFTRLSPGNQIQFLCLSVCESEEPHFWLFTACSASLYFTLLPPSPKQQCESLVTRLRSPLLRVSRPLIAAWCIPLHVIKALSPVFRTTT